MGHVNGRKGRRAFHWSEEVKQWAVNYQKDLAKSNQQKPPDHRQLVAQLSLVSGNPHDACLRFLRRAGFAPKRSYRGWTKPDQQRLIDLIEQMPINQAAKILGRPTASVRAMLHRLGLGSRRMREWFTTSLLAKALHIPREEVQRWIDRGWLLCRTIQASGLKIQIIDADDFCDFILKHGRNVIGNRLSYQGLLFVRDYVVPLKHADLLSVRGRYKKHAGRVADIGPADSPFATGLEAEENL